MREFDRPKVSRNGFLAGSASQRTATAAHECAQVSAGRQLVRRSGVRASMKSTISAPPQAGARFDTSCRRGVRSGCEMAKRFGLHVQARRAVGSPSWHKRREPADRRAGAHDRARAGCGQRLQVSDGER